MLKIVDFAVVSKPSVFNRPHVDNSFSGHVDMYVSVIQVWESDEKKAKIGLDRDLNPGPLAPKARIIPLDHQATLIYKDGFHNTTQRLTVTICN